MVEVSHNAFKIFLRLLVASLKEATLGANIDKLSLLESTETEVRGSLRRNTYTMVHHGFIKHLIGFLNQCEKTMII